MADQYIINKFGVLHTIPADWDLPAGARKATKEEIGAWREQDEANKAKLLADKKARAQERAQLVVVAGAGEQEPAERKGKAEPKKQSDDAKQ